MMDDAVAELPVRVRQLTWESEDVVSIRLEDPAGCPLPSWAPGAHLDIQLPNDLVRQYSLCGSPDDANVYRIAVLREQVSRGASDFLHDRLRVGDLLTIRGPRNHFAFAPAPTLLFIAGGIGITPLLPMMSDAEAAGADWRLLYGGRHRASMAFLEELEQYGERVSIAPEDEVGLLDLDAWLNQLGDDARVYCCGPEPLLGAVEELCASRPSGFLRVERFAAKPGATDSSESDESFTVRCVRSDVEVKVEIGQSILATLRNAGLDLPSSCEEGVCGTCEVRVLEGEVDHRDSILSEDERAHGETMMLCVSRTHDQLLVLEL
jgi:ferredoxin-NADP reductase